MASTTRSANGRSKQSPSRSSRSANRSAAATRSAASRPTRGATNGSRSRSSPKGRIAKVTDTIGASAKKAKTPLVAGGAAVAGLATGGVLGALLRGSRRPRVLGMPMPRAAEMKAGARTAARAGHWLCDVETDLRLLREHAEQSRRQSPIEVLLSGLTSRTLPRRR
jgi:hypothetical protein